MSEVDESDLVSEMFEMRWNRWWLAIDVGCDVRAVHQFFLASGARHMSYIQFLAV